MSLNSGHGVHTLIAYSAPDTKASQTASISSPPPAPTLPSASRGFLCLTMSRRFKFETVTYGVIAAIPVMVQSTDPLTWRTWLLALGTAVTAMKAKTSPGMAKAQVPDELPAIELPKAD